jgi:hypothetical protein
MLAAVILIVSIAVAPGFSPLPQDSAPKPLTKEFDLAHWGLKTVDQIGYVSLSILHLPEGDEIVIYDIRDKRPVIDEPEHVRSRTPEFEGEAYLVADFNRGHVNRLGGYFNNIQRAPSTAEVSLSAAPEGGRALTFVYTKETEGHAGFWMHLFDFKVPPIERVFFDASPFSFLTFKIRGGSGNEALALQVADREWEQKEDSLRIGQVGSFLPAGTITREWQQAWVPLSQLPHRIEKSELAGLIFLALEGGGMVQVQDIAFTLSEGAYPIKPDLPRTAEPAAGKAMWLWETFKLLKNRAAQDQLLEFCSDNGITELFLQVPYEQEKQGDDWIVEWDRPGLRDLLTRLHSQGLYCHALDGDARFALREWHDRVKALLREIIRFNRESVPEARFDAVRYDIEPYILPQFAGVQKNDIMSQYLSLLKDLKAMSEESGMEMGVDIPFWFDSLNRFFEPVAPYRGRPYSEAILDVVDNVGIMDYRTRAYGADGTITHADRELRYAEKRGKKIYVGLETGKLPDETILDFEAVEGPSTLAVRKLEGTRAALEWFPPGSQAPENRELLLFQSSSIPVPASKITFFNKTRRDLERVIRQTAQEFARYKSFAGFALHSYQSLRPWLERQK